MNIYMLKLIGLRLKSFFKLSDHFRKHNFVTFPNPVCIKEDRLCPACEKISQGFTDFVFEQKHPPNPFLTFLLCNEK